MWKKDVKKYDSKTKKYVPIEVYEKTQSLKKRDTCRGQKPHDFVLVLPHHVEYNETYKFDPTGFYDLMDERYQFVEDQAKALIKMGIKDRGWNRKETRLFICSVCGKQEYSDTNFVK